MSMANTKIQTLGQPIALPSGLKLPNRLVKAAMEEMMSSLGGGDPNESHWKAYSAWSRGGYGMIITGNVTFKSHLGSPRDIVIPMSTSSTYPESLAAFRRWADACHGTDDSKRPIAIIQICHTGRQSMRASGRGLFKQPLAPSAVRVKTGKGLISNILDSILFQEPKAMTLLDINDVVAGFLHCAKVAHSTGFDGVQLHCSHGYLLSQFMSPNTNLRTDEYGGSTEGRMKLLYRIIDVIRAELPLKSGFVLGIKLNSSDYVKGGLTEQDALNNVRSIAEHGGIDFIEISGGTYENPAMLGKEAPESQLRKPSASTVTRESFFLHFASEARQILESIPPESLPTPKPIVMVTGGFRTRIGMADAISSGCTDVVGLGRPICADVELGNKLLDPSIPDSKACAPVYKIKTSFLTKLLPLRIIGAGLETLYHTVLIAQIAKMGQADTRVSLLGGIWSVWVPKVALLRLTSVFLILIALCRHLII